MKHRKDGLKREHTMIQGLRKALEWITTWPEVRSVIPGAIRHVGKGAAFQLKVQYRTYNGLKCLARSGTAVQEVFIVTADPETVEQRLTS
jgi:hypothetical protein